MAFRAELLVRKKHTLNGARNFRTAITEAVLALAGFAEVEAARIQAMTTTELRPEVADSLILQSYERGIISSLQLPKVLKEWREPSFEEFAPRTAWSLFNAFTTVLRDRATTQPTHFTAQTMRLNALLGPQSLVTDGEPTHPTAA